MGLDVSTGEWFYKCLREDKDRPNHINTVTQTLIELAENMSAEELEYRMLADSAAADQWDTQIAKMHRSLLEHTRQGRAMERQKR